MARTKLVNGERIPLTAAEETARDIKETPPTQAEIDARQDAEIAAVMADSQDGISTTRAIAKTNNDILFAIVKTLQQAGAPLPAKLANVTDKADWLDKMLAQVKAVKHGG